ncbi:MAG: hypothetical protein MK080_11045 [Opitutales bacterium]|nr:hypothetical protein [Opitutales bacterium]NRA28201.1 hypothetical protein [Opitutales bacterium]
MRPFQKQGPWVSLGLAIMGGAGMLSVSFVLPIVGKLYDEAIASGLGAEVVLTALDAEEPLAVKAQAGLDTLGHVAFIPAILIAVFVLIAFLGQRFSRADESC